MFVWLLYQIPMLLVQCDVLLYISTEHRPALRRMVGFALRSGVAIYMFIRTYMCYTYALVYILSNGSLDVLGGCIWTSILVF